MEIKQPSNDSRGASPEVRMAVQRVDREMADLPRDGSGALRSAWSQLRGALALGPPRPTRDCPRCGNRGMADATLCGYCWMKLIPVDGALNRSDRLERERAEETWDGEGGQRPPGRAS